MRRAPARASQATDAIKALAGSYEMSNADRDRTCMLTLKADSGPGGFKLEFDRTACAAAFPPLKDVAAWTLFNDAIRLTDAQGQDRVRVPRGRRRHVRIAARRAAADVPAERGRVPRKRCAPTSRPSGDWNVVRSAGTPICSLTLTTNPAGSGDFAVQVKPGCDAAITRFGPTLWQMDRGELLLKSARGQVWRFEDANGAWQRVPTDRDPVMLIRP